MASDGDKPIGLMARCLGGIAGFGARRPRLALWVMVFFGCAGVGVTISEMKLHTSRSDLLAPEPVWEDYRTAFGGESDLVVVVETPTADAPLIQSVLDRLGERLEREPEYFSNVLYKIDQSALRRKALQYLTADELKAAIRRVDQFAPVLTSQQWDLLRVERLAGTLNKQIRTASARQASAETAAQYSERLATSLNGFLEVDNNDVRVNTHGFQSPWADIVSTEIERSAQDADLAYLMNNNHSVGMLHVHPVADDRKLEVNSRPLARIREHLAEVRKEFSEVAPDLKISLTGIPVLEHDELHRSGRDMINASLIAFLGVGLLLSFGLRGMRHPMLILIMLVNALAITFGVATLTVGHLNILSICFAAIMIGLGVDFGIHFITRYLFLRQELYEMDESLVLTAQSVGTGILTSALTTAIAFASAALTGYPGLAELGIITASGIVVCALLTFTFLPALIALSDERVEVDELPVPVSGDFWRSTVSGYPLTAITAAVIGILAVASNAVNFTDGAISYNVTYDSNLLKLQDSSLASVQAERALARSDESLLYAVAIANSREESDALREKILALPTVERVTDLSSRMPPPPNEAQKKLISELKTKLQQIPKTLPSFAASNPETVGVNLDNLYKGLKSTSDLRAHRAAGLLDEFLNRFASLQTEQQASVMDAYQNLMVSSLLKEFGQVQRAASVEPIGLEDLPEAWRNRYLRADGERQMWLLRIYPREDVWNEAALAAFVNDLRAVVPDVTGAPIQHFDSATKMKACYRTIVVYSLAAIALFLLFDFLRPGQKLLTMIPPLLIVGIIGYTSVQRNGELNTDLLVLVYLAMVAFIATVFDFRNLRDTFIAMIPSLGGGIMLLGLMSLLQIDFNPINLIVVPLVLGIGVDDGVHMVHDYRRQLQAGEKNYKPSGDTLNGVLLTSLTSIIGFGSLMISAHQGLKSVGIVLAIGVSCCLAVALILIPPLLVLVTRYQPASLEPVIIRPAKKTSDNDTADGDDSAESAENRRLSRKERRRQQQAA